MATGEVCHGNYLGASEGPVKGEKDCLKERRTSQESLLKQTSPQPRLPEKSEGLAKGVKDCLKERRASQHSQLK